MNTQPYHSLIVWQAAYSFIREIYSKTTAFPLEERYGIMSQIRRAAVSVGANIVEGYAKASPNDFLRFLNISRGSLTECAFLLELSRDLGYLSEADYNTLEQLRGRTGFMLQKYMEGIRKNIS